MKNLIALFAALLITLTGFAQQGINYKAVLKDASGNLLSDTFMNVQFTIHQSIVTGAIVYQEDHNYTTDANGLLILNIGTDPSPSVGVFADIDWGADLHFFQTTITYSGGTIDFDATEFMAVPYAKHAQSATLKTVNNVTSNSPGDISADSFVFGSNQMDDDPAITDDNFRMFFNKTKGAFRSGIASNNEWDDVNIGIGSTSLGNGTIASGDNATAFGLGSKALGNNSTALGKNTFASAENSLAIGWLNVDEPDALFMVGNGFFDGINADFSNALEVYNDGQVIAPSSDLAEIIDDKALITKEYLEANTSVSTGLEYLDETDDAIDNGGWRLKGFDPANYGPIGDGAVDLSYSEFESTIHGATGTYSTAIGYRTKATGLISTAMGQETTASGSYSTSLGFSSTASGDSSTAIGFSTNASGILSFATGSSTNASGYNSIAMGAGAEASGDYSTAIGKGLTSPSYAETVVGSHNLDYIPSTSNGPGAENWNPTDRLFVIGNGTGFGGENNALTILKNGKVGIGRDTPASILEVAHDDTPPTFGDRTDAFSIRNKSTNQSWQFHTSTYLNLYFNGAFRGSWNATSGAYVQASDRRVKKDITPLENGTLDKVMQLNPVSYLMKEQTDNKRNLGLISQEVQELFPSITHYVEESDLLTLSYTELIPILIKALQEQQLIIETQKSKLQTQQSENTTQNQAIQSLLKRMTALETANNQ